MFRSKFNQKPYVTRLINKIDSPIYEFKKPEKVVRLSDQLTFILEKVKGVDDQLITLRITPYLSVFSPNGRKYGPEKLQIRTLSTQCKFGRKP